MFAPDAAAGGDPPDPTPDPIPEPTPDKELEIELSDDTNLQELESESIQEIMEMDNIQLDKVLDWVKMGMKDPLLYKDIKEIVKKEKDDAEHHDKDPGDADPDDKTVTDAIDADDNNAGSDAAKPDPKPADEKDKTLEPKIVIVNEDFIQKQLQSLRDQLKGKDPAAIEKQLSNMEIVLKGINGGQMDTRSFKNYVNAQMYIKTLKSPLDKDWKPDAAVVNTPEYIEKAQKQKAKMIADALRDKYPDYPADGDPEAVAEFEDALSNREYEDYKATSKQKASEIGNNYDRYQHLVENWEDIAKDTLKAEVQLFVKKLESLKVKPADLGITSLDLDDTAYNEYLYKNLLFNEKGEANPEIFDFVDNVIPIIKPTTVFNNLMNQNLDLILQFREAAARKEAYRKGIDDQPDPSLSDNPTNPGQREEIEITADAFEDPNLSIEQHDKLLDRIKRSISSKKR